MIDSIPLLPGGVTIQDMSLKDKSMQQSYPINEMAAYFLTRIDGKRSVASISATIAEQYQQPEQEVLLDMLELSKQLHSHRLLNIKETWKQTLFRLSLSMRSRTMMPLNAWRYEVPSTSNYGLLLLWLCAIVAKTFLPLFFLVLLCITVIILPLSLSLTVVPLYLVTWGCIILSVALHETSHLATLRWKLGRESGFVVCSGPFIHICRPPLKKLTTELLVSLSGPLTPTIIAIFLLLYHFFHGSWFDWLPISVFGIHSLQLFFPNQDIRNITRMLVKRK